MYKPSLYSDFIYTSRYARYIDSKKRRETWPETVKRYMDFVVEFLKENNNYDVPVDLREELEMAILSHHVMPSMRGLMTAGAAAKRNNCAIYNCSFLPIDDMKAFDEEMAILMSGTGVGYSVESIHVKNLPEIPEELFESNTTVVFEDSRLGWAKGYREFLSLLLSGQIAKYDVSALRPAGARLKTIGGRSSGPEPLVELLEFTKTLFIKAKGRKFTTLEAHDLACKVADIVVVGGVRRSALISLSDLQDERMRDAKSGQWWQTNPYRRLANNSAVYNEKPEIGTFMKEWLALYESKSGERGIFARHAIKTVINNANDYRTKNFASFLIKYGIEPRVREYRDDMGTNPCSEIILRPYEFCNLTSVQIYEDDTWETLDNKVRLATILGTFQSCFTNFKYINKKWKKNCEEERLLGVSLNGIYDNDLTNGKESYLHELLTSLKKTAIVTNGILAKEIGIPSSVAITCVKPEGCLSLDTKIKTTEGIKTIASIFGELTSYDIFEMDGGNWIIPDRKMYVYDENNDKKEITKLYVNGMSEVYEIVMEDNTVVKLTANHQLKTTNGWKKAKDLSETDEILSW